MKKDAVRTIIPAILLTTLLLFVAYFSAEKKKAETAQMWARDSQIIESVSVETPAESLDISFDTYLAFRQTLTTVYQDSCDGQETISRFNILPTSRSNQETVRTYRLFNQYGPVTTITFRSVDGSPTQIVCN